MYNNITITNMVFCDHDILRTGIIAIYLSSSLSSYNNPVVSKTYVEYEDLKFDKVEILLGFCGISTSSNSFAVWHESETSYSFLLVYSAWSYNSESNTTNITNNSSEPILERLDANVTYLVVCSGSSFNTL